MKPVCEAVDPFGIPISEDVEGRLKQIIIGTISKIKNAARVHDVTITTDLDELKRDAMRVIELKHYVMDDVSEGAFDPVHSNPALVGKEKKAGFKQKLLQILEELGKILMEIKRQEEPQLNVRSLLKPFTEIEVQ